MTDHPGQVNHQRTTMQCKAEGVRYVEYVEASRTCDAKQPYKISSVKNGVCWERFSFGFPANNCSGGDCSYIMRRRRQRAIDIGLAGSRMRFGRIFVE